MLDNRRNLLCIPVHCPHLRLHNSWYMADFFSQSKICTFRTHPGHGGTSRPVPFRWLWLARACHNPHPYPLTRDQTLSTCHTLNPRFLLPSHALPPATTQSPKHHWLSYGTGLLRRDILSWQVKNVSVQTSPYSVHCSARIPVKYSL